MVDNLVLHQKVHDQQRWRFTRSGSYISTYAYHTFFIGTIKFTPWKQIWKSWSALQIFISLVVNSRCWTAGRLAKRGLPYPVACPLCDQAEETIQHTIISCVFARQVWTLIFQRLGLIAIVPQPTAAQFSAWWSNAISRVPKVLREGLNSLIILIPWELWKHRNDCV